MSKFTDVSAWIEERLPAVLAEHNVPAASIAVSLNDETFTFAHGVLNLDTGVTADTNSVFQIGSVTKVWTATLIMQLADEGKLDIDAPIRLVLPDFAIVDEAAASAITTRMMLSHIAGFEGDFFTDTGNGDNAVEEFVKTLVDVPQLFTPGECFSYNNAAYVVLGRIIEVLRGKAYNQVLREFLATPLGLSHFSTNAAEAIRFRAALGHVPGETADALVTAPVWNLPLSNAPAGAMLAMTARDLLTFAQMHMAGGTTPSGDRVLSAASVAMMQENQVDLPDLGVMGDSWGLGWELFDWEGGRVIGHDGNTIGQNAFLRIAPEADLAVALLTNIGNAIPVYDDVVRHILAELAGITMPALPTPAAEPEAVDLERIVGTYGSAAVDSTVSVDEDGKIWLTQTMKGIFAELGPDPEPVELVSWRGDTLLPAIAQSGIHMPHVFVGDAGDGRALYLHTGRANRRLGA